MFHLDDILKKRNKKQKDELIDFMIDISKGWVLKPYSLFRDLEIENAVLHKLGLKPLYDIKSQIIGTGVAYLAGDEYYPSSRNQYGQKWIDENGKNKPDVSVIIVFSHWVRLRVLAMLPSWSVLVPKQNRLQLQLELLWIPCLDVRYFLHIPSQMPLHLHQFW